MNKTMTACELKFRLAAGAAFNLLDVRKPEDFAEHPQVIPGALKLEVSEVEARSGELNSSLPTIVYCARGGRLSHQARDLLALKGIDAAILVGGYAAWLQSMQDNWRCNVA